MEMPTQITPMFWGAVAGAVAVTLIGFNWGGWTTSSTADAMAMRRANEAVVSALAPICVENFRQEADTTTQQATLKKANSWEQSSLVEKFGWATMPGSDKPTSGVARACADMISALKL